jgi:CrcB protein
MDRLFLVFVGGGLGSAARYLLSVGMVRALGAAFPFGTLCVNLVGCLAMGALLQIAVQASSLSPALRLALSTGLLGGFTTYSSFNYETTKLFEGGAIGFALLNLFGTVFGCFLAGLVGAWLGRQLTA